MVVPLKQAMLTVGSCAANFITRYFNLAGFPKIFFLKDDLNRAMLRESWSFAKNLDEKVCWKKCGSGRGQKFYYILSYNISCLKITGLFFKFYISKVIVLANDEEMLFGENFIEERKKLGASESDVKLLNLSA